jgi:ArsR family transcriptional regulator
MGRHFTKNARFALRSPFVKAAEAVKSLGALAQATRLEVFRLLVKAGPAGLAAGRIGEALGVAPATLSFHLKELAQAGLVEARQDRRFIYYSADFERMNGLLAFLTENCCEGSAAGCAVPACPPAPKGRRRARG